MMRRSPRSRRVVLAICSMLLTFGLTPTAHAAATSAYVRINQLGYPATLPKQAFVMSSADEAGGSFSVVDTATHASVFTGSIPASAGSWSSAYGFVHPLDFSSVTAP